MRIVTPRNGKDLSHCKGGKSQRTLFPFFSQFHTLDESMAEKGVGEKSSTKGVHLRHYFGAHIRITVILCLHRSNGRRSRKPIDLSVVVLTVDNLTAALARILIKQSRQ